jgi:hypothetical protein
LGSGAKIAKYVPPKEEAAVCHFFPLVMPASNLARRILFNFVIEEIIERHGLVI